jgi:radical SAM protein with 4Fe4S-binding SPASM domain
MMGDPLLHPSLLQFIDTAKNKGCLPEIATNSLAFRGEEHMRRILLSGLNYMILDMSRWKERPQIMDKAIANIEALCKLHVQLGNEGYQLPTMALQIVTNTAKNQVFPDWALESAYDAKGKILLKKKFLDTWAGQMESLYDYTEVVTPPERKPCAEPFERVVILQNGDVAPCCRDAEGLTIYGNIMQTPLRDIWHGEVVNGIRSKMLAGDYGSLPEPCRSCRESHIPMNRKIATESGSDYLKSNA